MNQTAETTPAAPATDTPPATENQPPTTVTTPPHILARNRQNARKSTGPRTPEGKLAASLNAHTHGLRSRLDEGTVVPLADREHYTAFLQDLRDHLDPRSPLDHLLVERIALLGWKLRRHA